MLFSELYSAYYGAVAAILNDAVKGKLTETEIYRHISENAFSESVLTIAPALKEERWQLLREDNTTPLQHAPTMPLTLLQKRWLKAILQDKRMKLFDLRVDGLETVEPLFTEEDYRIFDQYADGDPFEDETYIRNFRFLCRAIREEKPVRLVFPNRAGKVVAIRCFPKRLEYSEKDDKFRLIAGGCRYAYFNLAKILECRYCNGDGAWTQEPNLDSLRELTLQITDDRNALERVMLHFAHFEKQAEKIDDQHYNLHIKYYSNDETEMVIRVLSFGPYVKALEPGHFVSLVKKRLTAQVALTAEQNQGSSGV